MNTGNNLPPEVNELQQIQDSIKFLCSAITSGADEEAELDLESKDKHTSIKINIYDALEKLLAKRRELKHAQTRDND